MNSARTQAGAGDLRDGASSAPWALRSPCRRPPNEACPSQEGSYAVSRHRRCNSYRNRQFSGLPRANTRSGARCRTGLRMGHGSLVDTMLVDGLWDAFNQYHMGRTAEHLARRHGITREQQDEYADLSQRRATAAISAGHFRSQITPIMVPKPRRDPVAFVQDEQPRPDTNVAALATLRPAFETGGTVTAGNSSTLNDGAAAVLV